MSAPGHHPVNPYSRPHAVRGSEAEFSGHDQRLRRQYLHGLGLASAFGGAAVLVWSFAFAQPSQLSLGGPAGPLGWLGLALLVASFSAAVLTIQSAARRAWLHWRRIWKACRR